MINIYYFTGSTNKDPNILDINILQMVRLIKDNEEIKLSKRTGKTISLMELSYFYYFPKNSREIYICVNISGQWVVIFRYKIKK